MKDGRLSDLSDLAESQLGYFTQAQAHVVVADSSLRQAVTNGRLVDVTRGVYRFASSPAHRLEDLYGAWMQLDPSGTTDERCVDPDILVFGRSALELFGIGDLPATRHTFAVKRRRRVRRQDVFQQVRQRERSDWTIVDGMPVALPSWVIAGIVGSGTDLEHVQMMLDDARLERIDMDDFRDRLNRGGGIAKRASRYLQ